MKIRNSQRQALTIAFTTNKIYPAHPPIFLINICTFSVLCRPYRKKQVMRCVKTTSLCNSFSRTSYRKKNMQNFFFRSPIFVTNLLIFFACLHYFNKFIKTICKIKIAFCYEFFIKLYIDFSGLDRLF